MSVWILHDSHRYAWASFFAGIPIRRGYGQGIQHLLLSDPIHVDKPQLKLHPIEVSNLLLEKYAVPKIESEPILPLASEITEKIDKQFANVKKPWIVIGIGSSEPVKQCLQPPQSEQGMAGITVAHVLTRINELFTHRK